MPSAEIGRLAQSEAPYFEIAVSTSRWCRALEAWRKQGDPRAAPSECLRQASRLLLRASEPLRQICGQNHDDSGGDRSPVSHEASLSQR